MYFHRSASLVLALVVSACASSPDTPLGDVGGTVQRAAPGTSTPAARGTSTLIVRAELEQRQGDSAYRVIESLHQNWLRENRRNTTLGDPASYARVVVDGTPRGELSELSRMSANEIESMRFISAPDATMEYGTGYPAGAIEVTMRGQGAGTVATGSRTERVTAGSQPVAGDFLRVECFSPQAQEGRIAEGFFEGAAGGELLLSAGSQSQRIAVPVVDVTRVEVRTRRSRSREGALIGALIGAVTGAVIGDSRYERESAFHLRREIYGAAGGVVGALAGLAAGAVIGSFFKTDVWSEVPQNWVVRYSESGSTTLEDSALAMGCLSPDMDAR